jgi:hypothetical protein
MNVSRIQEKSNQKLHTKLTGRECRSRHNECLTLFALVFMEALVMSRCLLSLCVGVAFCLPLAGQDQGKPVYAGPTDKGFLLPSGWTLTPAGKHVEVTDLPLNIIPLPDGRHALVATNGYNQHQLSLIDLNGPKIVDQQTVWQSWFGLAQAPAGGTIWWSGGGAGALHTFTLEEGKLKRTSPNEPEPAKAKKKDLAKLKDGGFKSGLLLDAKRDLLYSLNINQGTICAIDLKTGTAGPPAPCGSRPYDLACPSGQSPS